MAHPFPVPASSASAPLTNQNFKHVAALLMREAAITLEPGKEYLVETRLAPIAVKHGLASANDVVARLRASEPALTDLHLEVVDALTTNETLFFRDVHPWDSLRKHVIPKLREARASTRTITVWSAACSTGQEPYSLAMLLAEHFPDLAGWSIRIIGTDISPTVLKRAESGVFQQLEVNRGLPAIYLVKHFRQEGRNWILSEAIRRRVEFRPLNLARHWTGLPRCDLVFMRNVMIYFDVETRRTILRQLRHVLAPDGFLLLGTAETAVNLDNAFNAVTFDRATFFQAAP